MGTSKQGTGPRPATPLIPDWINDQNGPEPSLQPNDNPQPDNPDAPEIPEQPQPEKAENRFAEARNRFSSYVKDSSNGNSGALRDAFRSYVNKSGGGPGTFSKRMRPAAARVSGFVNLLDTVRENLGNALVLFNLTEYQDRPLLEVLGAFTDVIFDEDSPYANIQDDSINKLAYSQTIIRIAEDEQIDLGSLSNENIEVMTAIFIEETIATRVICDIGQTLFKKDKLSSEIIDIEENVYQIVSGLVRVQIMPEIIATHRGNKEELEKKIENIYRIAFDCIAGTLEN
ncbi:hypothetical protein [Pedobacter jeongneungensis]|uniref:hypothetical protein n=1 Tax=Pedobacter jeongneungensis TaxID=947309 RepID=UPI00046A299D|nr:hypothetical protein [Pedobacter jeongneungensis]